MYTPDWPVPEYSDGWPEWEDTAMKQGWDDDTVKEVALGFIRSRREIHKFERYCKQLADEENAQMEEDVCTACGGTGQMGGAICAHCEDVTT